MQDIEPYYNWVSLYNSSEDELSPLFGHEHNEFEYVNAIYNFYIHPQWDSIISPTLYIKILYADYMQGYAIIEMIGEWNDAINNDIMFLKRDIADILISEGINKFILIGENVLNFHISDDCYYEEWFQDVEDGWIVALNFREHVILEFERGNIDYYLGMGGELDTIEWRTYSPMQLFERVEKVLTKRIGP